MMRKIFGVKSISHLIYGLLMLAPILAIGVKCGYVMLNKNAKDSYYGESINNKTYTPITAIDDNLLDKTIYFDIKTAITSRTSGYGSNESYIYFDNLNVIATNYSYDFSNMIAISFYVGANSTNLNCWLYDGTNRYGMNNSGVFTATFNYTANAMNQITKDNLVEDDVFKYISYNNNSYLDNVFYYAIDEIIQDNNFGKVNFTGWFDNMMLDNNIQINQTYTHLFNWYLNYTLFISCAYILWLVLMWFVNFARKLLDRGMNYDW